MVTSEDLESALGPFFTRLLERQAACPSGRINFKFEGYAVTAKVQVTHLKPWKHNPVTGAYEAAD